MSARPWVERAIVRRKNRNATVLYAYLPADEQRARAWLEQVLGKRVEFERVQRHGVAVWELNAKHLIPLAGAMAHAYGPTKMRIEVMRKEKCDWRCQNAKYTPVGKCVCSCAGEFHMGRGARNDWYPAGRTTLVRYEKTTIKQLIIVDGQLPNAKKIPRPAPAAPTEIAPPHHPRPPKTIPPLPRPAPAATQVPRTVIPAASPFGDHEPGRSDRSAARPGDTGRPVTVPVRKPAIGPLIAAVLMFVALGGGVWLVLTPAPPAAQQITDQETVQPSTTSAELPPSPPPVVEEAAAPQPRFPAGCFPFQSGC